MYQRLQLCSLCPVRVGAGDSGLPGEHTLLAAGITCSPNGQLEGQHVSVGLSVAAAAPGLNSPLVRLRHANVSLACILTRGNTALAWHKVSLTAGFTSCTGRNPREERSGSFLSNEYFDLLIQHGVIYNLSVFSTLEMCVCVSNSLHLNQKGTREPKPCM